MKVDTEALVKNLFWILTLLCVPLVAVALVVLGTSVAGKITKQKKEIDEVVKTVTSFADPKRPDEVEVKKKEAELHKALETVVWDRAYQTQAKISTWPEAFEDHFHFKDGLFALKIQADRSKSAGGEAAAAEPAPGVFQFQGDIKGIERDWMDVSGKENKEAKVAKIKRFYRTAAAKITLSDETNKDQTVPYTALKPNDHVVITYEQGKYFGDELTETEMKSFTDTYKVQLPDILKTVDPVDEKGQGVVQLKGWGFSDDAEQIPPGASFLVFHAGPWRQNRFLSKEAWTAQEDVWIQRELYRLIRLANDYVARCHGQGGDGKGKPFLFNNPYWELKLTLTEDNKLAINLKNLLHRRQKADMHFLVKLRPDADPESIEVGGLEPLNPGQVRDAKAVKVKTDNPTGIYSVEQVLTPETAAVRRIDLVAIGAGVNPSAGGGPGGGAPGLMPARGPQMAARGPAGVLGGGSAGSMSLAQSDRTCVKPLVAKEFPGDPKEKEGGEAAAPVGAPGMPGGGLAPGLPGGPGGPAGAVKGTPSVNGFVFERYVDPITPQSRRVPVAVVLIVDQQHVGLVQAAFADSVLRFLTTQVLMNRYPHNLRSPEALAAGPKGGGFMAPGLPPRPPAFPPGMMPGTGRMPGFMPGGMRPPGTGFGPPVIISGSPFPGMPGGDSGETGAAEEPEANVELVLYGVVSLYERYPPRTTTPNTGS